MPAILVLPTAHASLHHGRLYTGLSAPTCAPANVRAPHSSHPPPSYSSQGTSADVLRPNCDDVRASGRTSAPPCAAVAYLALFDLTLGAVPIHCWRTPVAITLHDMDKITLLVRVVIVLPEVFGVNGWVRSVAALGVKGAWARFVLFGPSQSSSTEPTRLYF